MEAQANRLEEQLKHSNRSEAQFIRLEEQLKHATDRMDGAFNARIAPLMQIMQALTTQSNMTSKPTRLIATNERVRACAATTVGAAEPTVVTHSGQSAGFQSESAESEAPKEAELAAVRDRLAI